MFLESNLMELGGEPSTDMPPSFLIIFSLAIPLSLTFDLLTSKSNQLFFVSQRT